MEIEKSLSVSPGFLGGLAVIKFRIKGIEILAV